MKSMSTFFAIILLFSIQIFAQIPNSGFETWTTDGNGDNNPDGWGTSNSDPFVSVTPYTPAYAGSFSMKVATFNPGMMELGGNAMAEFAYSQRPATLNVCFKANVMPGDHIYIVVSLNSGDSIVAAPGDCSFAIDTSVTEFTCMSFPISYISGLTPDLANIMIMAGSSAAQTGTWIIVDEISFDGTAGIDTQNPSEWREIQNYPNPADDVTELSIELKQAAVVDVVVFDIQGKKVLQTAPQQMEAGQQSIVLSTATLPNGLYTYSIISSEFIYQSTMMVTHVY